MREQVTKYQINGGEVLSLEDLKDTYRFAGFLNEEDFAVIALLAPGAELKLGEGDAVFTVTALLADKWGGREPLRKPMPGMGITYSINGDCYPYTIRRVSKSGHQFWAVQDDFVAEPGKNEAYSGADKVGKFTPVLNGEERLFTRKRDGRYQAAGSSYIFVYAGRRFAQDPHF